MTFSFRPPSGTVVGFEPKGKVVRVYEAGRIRVRTRNSTKAVLPVPSDTNLASLAALSWAVRGRIRAYLIRSVL